MFLIYSVLYKIIRIITKKDILKKGKKCLKIGMCMVNIKVVNELSRGCDWVCSNGNFVFGYIVVYIPLFMLVSNSVGQIVL